MTNSVSIPVIQEIVSTASHMPIEQIRMKDGIASARKREKTTPRMISMALSKQYTRHTLGYIGMLHGGRDHATVLHAIKTVNNLLDTKDSNTVEIYRRSKKSIDRILMRRKQISDSIRMRSKMIPVSRKTMIIKSCIKNNVSLEKREQILNTLLTKYHYREYEYSTSALPTRLQKGY